MNENLNDFVIVILPKSEKERLVEHCVKKQVALYEYCQKAIIKSMEEEA